MSTKDEYRDLLAQYAGIMPPDDWTFFVTHESALQQRITELEDTERKLEAAFDASHAKIKVLEAKCEELERDNANLFNSSSNWEGRFGTVSAQFEEFKAKVLASPKVNLVWELGADESKPFDVADAALIESYEGLDNLYRIEEVFCVVVSEIEVIMEEDLAPKVRKIADVDAGERKEELPKMKSSYGKALEQELEAVRTKISKLDSFLDSEEKERSYARLSKREDEILASLCELTTELEFS